jgi:hypothetical protein
MNRTIYWGLGIVMVLIWGCNRSQKAVPVVNRSKIETVKKQEQISVNIKRYEQALAKLDKQNLAQELPKLQHDYAFFLGKDSLVGQQIQQIQNYLNDPVIKQLYSAVDKKYAEVSDLEMQFTEGFSLLKYYFPEAQIPQIYTAITGLYFEEYVSCYDTNLIISLDLYLGKDYPLYKRLGGDVPKYIMGRFSKEYILPDCFRQISYRYMNIKNSRSTMLEEMIVEGKSLLFMEAMLPQFPDSVLYPYSQETIEWAMRNEGSIWGYVIENDYLYSKDMRLIRKFVGDTPFTAAFGKQSPGAIGKWLGWQICRAWVRKNPDKHIRQLMQETDAQKILTESKYKPKR